MPKRFKAIVAKRGGWSDWQHPDMKGYLLKCCDCGLVHEMQFGAIEQLGPENARREWPYRPIKNGRIKYRVRRASLKTQ